MKSSLRLTLLPAALACLLACGDDDGTPAETTVFLDDASDEAFAVFQAEVAAGHATVDAKASTLVAPADGATVPAASPVTISWSAAAEKPALPHGVETGRFVWVSLTGDGALAGGVNVVSLSSTNWTPDAGVWSMMVDAGTVDVAIFTANFEEGAVTEGPFRPAAQYSFTVTP